MKVTEYPCHPPTAEAMLRVNVAMVVDLWLEDEGLLTQEVEQKTHVLVDEIMGEVKRRFVPTPEGKEMIATELEKQLTATLNRHCAENDSNTPDWILAQYLIGCLSAFNQAVQQREDWYGIRHRPGESTEVVGAAKK